MFSKTLFPFGIAILLFASRASAGEINYQDGFEATGFNSFWNLQQDSGSINLASSLVHNGSQAAQFNSVNTGSNRYQYLYHNFPETYYGTTSVWLFDNGADVLSSNYMNITLGNSNIGEVRTIGVFDYDLGPGNNGSVYYVGQGGVWSGVDRTQQWHKFLITATPTNTQFFIDDALIFTDAVGFAFDRVQIGMQAPSGRPEWVGTFDDFSISATSASAPEPGSIALFGSGMLIACLIVRRRRCRASL